MGRLSVACVSTNTPPVSNSHTQSTTDNKTFDTTSTVYAEINIVKQTYFSTTSETYRYIISGVPYTCIGDIPTLVAQLEYKLEKQRYQKDQYADTHYDIPRQLTFSAAGQPPQAIVITSSARALYNALEATVKNKQSAVTTLIINDKAQFYCENRGNWRSGALELLPQIFTTIQSTHFPSLTFLQLFITMGSRNIINGLKDLLARHCLPHLQTLDLQFAAFCRAYTYKQGWTYTDDIQQNGVHGLYREGLVPGATALRALKHLHLPFWCANATAYALTALETLYPQLKTLSVDRIISTAIKGKARLECQTNDNRTDRYTAPYASTYVASSGADDYLANEQTIPTAAAAAKQPSLLKLLEKMQHHSQLECLEVYDWPPGKQFVADYSILQTAIHYGWLPKLNTIALRFNIVARYNYLLDITIDPATAMDSTPLLNTVLYKAVPLNKLQLIMPEKNGYQDWLDAMAQGAFPKLQQLHYRLPDRWTHEEEQFYHARIETALHTLYRAVCHGYLPRLSAFVVEGNEGVGMRNNIDAPPIPADLLAMVQTIDDAILVQQSQVTRLDNP